MTPDTDGRWDDRLRAELLDRRTVMLTGALDGPAATSVAAQLMTLDATGDEPVQLHVDSAGGTLDGATAVMDVTDLLGVPVHARCIGRCEGPALFVFAVCDRRVVAPHAQLRLCEPESEFAGSASDLGAWAERRREAIDRVCTRLAEATGRPAAMLARALEERRYLSPGEAVAMGLADEVARPPGQLRPLPRPLGYRPS